jgi:hypothetical protein
MAAPSSDARHAGAAGDGELLGGEVPCGHGVGHLVEARRRSQPPESSCGRAARSSRRLPRALQNPLHRGPHRHSKKKPAGGRIKSGSNVRSSCRLSENAFYTRKRRAAADILVLPRMVPDSACPLLSFG